MTTQRFPYVQVDPALGVASALPYIPVTLTHGQQEIVATALVDSGAAINVLPYPLAFSLGPFGNSRPSLCNSPATWPHLKLARYS